MVPQVNFVTGKPVTVPIDHDRLSLRAERRVTT